MVFMDEAAFRRMIREESKEALKELIGDRRVPSSAPDPSGLADFADLTTAGSECGVSANTIRDWVRKGFLPSYGKGKHLRVKRTELAAFLTRRDQRGDDSDAQIAASVDRALKKVRLP